MYNTYKNLLLMSNLYEGNETKSELAVKYKETGDPIYLAEIYCRYYPYIQTTAGRYFNLTDEDKASFAVEELHKAIQQFDETKGIKIQTLFITYFNNRLRTETQALNLQKRKANNGCDSFELAATLFEGENDDSLAIAELQAALEQSGNLSENELMYCKIVMRTENVIDSDIASKLGISPSAVFQLKRRLAKKLDINILLVS